MPAFNLYTIPSDNTIKHAYRSLPLNNKNHLYYYQIMSALKPVNDIITTLATYLG